MAAFFFLLFLVLFFFFLFVDGCVNVEKVETELTLDCALTPATPGYELASRSHDDLGRLSSQALLWIKRILQMMSHQRLYYKGYGRPEQAWLKGGRMKNMEKQVAEYSAYLAFDWSHKSHRFSLCDAGMGKLRTGDLENTPEAMYRWFFELRIEYPEGKIAVILEQARGSLIHFLLSLDYLVVFCVNPKAVAKYRETFQVSGCKDDPTDASGSAVRH